MMGYLRRRPVADAAAAALGRCLIVYLFVGAASLLLSPTGWQLTLTDMENHGLPAPKVLLILAMAFSSLASLALLLDVKARWAAYALAGYTFVVSSTMHNPLHAVGSDFYLFVKDLGVAGTLMALGAVLSSPPTKAA